MILGIFLTAGCMSCDSDNNNNFAGRVDIGNGRKMYIQCRGSGGPTIVFVSGLVLVDYLPYELRNELTDKQWEDWKKVSSPTEAALVLYPDQERLDNQKSLEQELAAIPIKNSCFITKNEVSK